MNAIDDDDDDDESTSCEPPVIFVAVAVKAGEEGLVINSWNANLAMLVISESFMNTFASRVEYPPTMFLLLLMLFIFIALIPPIIKSELLSSVIIDRCGFWLWSSPSPPLARSSRNITAIATQDEMTRRMELKGCARVVTDRRVGVILILLSSFCHGSWSTRSLVPVSCSVENRFFWREN